MKKLFAVIVGLVMVCSLAACGPKANQPAADDQTRQPANNALLETPRTGPKEPGLDPADSNADLAKNPKAKTAIDNAALDKLTQDAEQALKTEGRKTPDAAKDNKAGDATTDNTTTSLDNAETNTQAADNNNAATDDDAANADAGDTAESAA